MSIRGLQTWTDKSFAPTVVILAILGSATLTVVPSSFVSIGIELVLRLCGAAGCFLWAVYLRKTSPGIWLILGLVPFLPELYLFGFHRGRRRARLPLEAPADCPRCGMFLSGGRSCSNCQWSFDYA